MVKGIATLGFVASLTSAVFTAATTPASAASETILYSFRGGNDGGFPYADLLDVHGKLYGTTTGASGLATAFSTTTSGTEKPIYAFKDALPEAGLIDLKGTLYGTTATGGEKGCNGSGCGTVFSMTLNGTEKVLYAFNAGSDGAQPQASLVAVKGMLYGTTLLGGTGNCRGSSVGGCGTIFSITPDGNEKVLYSFKGGSDGCYPWGALTAVGNKLYGTAASCGKGGEASGVGAIYSIDLRDDDFEIVYDFPSSGKNGGKPIGGLLNLNGVLYGTTHEGGRKSCGTVFSVTTKGVEEVLHSFGCGGDGGNPYGDLLNVGGTLYGTTALDINGVCNTSESQKNCGTVFSIDPSTGSEKVLHVFTGGISDGANPRAGLVSINGMLYGTTVFGGFVCEPNFGYTCGTVFSIAP